MGDQIAVFCEKCDALFPISRQEKDFARVCCQCHSRTLGICAGCGNRCPQKDKLCHECQIRCYPQQYQVCRFCKGASTDTCNVCDSRAREFYQWLKQVFANDLKSNPCLENVIYRVASKNQILHDGKDSPFPDPKEMRGQLDSSLGNLKSGELENSIGQQLARMRYLKLSQSKLLTSQLEDPEVEELNYYSMEADLDQTYATQTNVTDSKKSVDEDDYAFWLQNDRARNAQPLFLSYT